MNRRNIILIVLSLVALNIFGQGYYFGATDILSPNDTIILRLGQHTGTKQWQKSYNKTDWSDIKGATADTLLFVADSTTFFRAKVTAFDCDPYFSDTIQVPVLSINKNAIIADTATTKLMSDSLDILAGTYIYQDMDTSILDTAKAFIDPRTEEMRKIVSFRKEGDNVIIETEQADLTDFVEDFEIEDSMLLVMNEGASTKSAIKCDKIYPVELLYKAPGSDFKSGGIGVSFDGSTLYNGTVYYQKNGKTFAGNLKVTIENGEFNFTPCVHKALKIKWFKIKKFKLSVSGAIDYDMDIKISSNIQYSYAKEILLASYKFKGPKIGPVPTDFIVNIYGGFKTNVDAQGAITVGFDVYSRTELGAKYEGGEWNAIKSQTTDFNNHDPVWTADMNVKSVGHLRPQVKFIIGKVAGPVINFKPYLEFDAHVPYPNYYDTLYAGMDMSIGFEVKILKKTLASFDKYFPDVIREDIYHNSGSLSYSAPSVSLSTSSWYSSIRTTTTATDNGGAIIDKGICYSTSGTPVISQSKNVIYIGPNSSNYTISGLEMGVDYKIRAFAINKAGVAYSDLVTAQALSVETGTVTDIEGNTYRTVKIGDQWWMAENLKTTGYNVMTTIPVPYPHLGPLPIDNITDFDQWCSTTKGAYCWYKNDISYKNTYGALYNWYTVATGLLCPTGWHVPTDAEWTILTDYLGGVYVAGGKLKEAGTSHWASPNYGATNESGFSALPGGYINPDDPGRPFQYMGTHGKFWSSDENPGNGGGIYRRMHYTSDDVNNYAYDKNYGFSVRCIKD